MNDLRNAGEHIKKKFGINESAFVVFSLPNNMSNTDLEEPSIMDFNNYDKYGYVSKASVQYLWMLSCISVFFSKISRKSH